MSWHVWRCGRRILGRSIVGGSLAVALTIVPALTARGAAVGGARGQVTVMVVGAGRATGPVCLTLRDLTKNMVVGSYCDGDTVDNDARVGRISLDLPRRSFAVDARAPGAKVKSVTPRHFQLGRRQTIVVRLT
jgi:hypothetical protein